MKTFILGFAVAVLICVGIYVAVDDPRRATEGSAPTGRRAGVQAGEESMMSPAAPAAARTAAASPPAGGKIVSTPFSRGDVTLRVGEGCILDTGAVLSVADADAGDVVCADLNNAGAMLECPFGGMGAQLPALLLGPHPTVELAYAGVTDAPLEFDGKVTWLGARFSGSESGIVLARSKTGKCFKIVMDKVADSPRVLERTITLRFEAVPSRAGGGRMHLDGQPEPADLSPASLEALKRMRSRPGLPRDSFRSNVGTSFTAVTELPDHTELPVRANIALTNPLNGEILIPRGGSIYATHGVGRNGKLNLKSYSGGLIEGDMDGEILIDSYAYIHITGNLNGTVDCRSYATVLVDGDVRGVLRVNSMIEFFLGGQFTDPRSGLDAPAASSSTFYFSSFTAQSTMELFPGMSQITLHVRTSDLPAGKHVGIGRWKEVVVGDPLWARLH